MGSQRVRHDWVTELNWIDTQEPWWCFTYVVVYNSWYPVDCSLPHSSIHGILQAKILEIFSRMAKSYGSSIFSFFRNIHIFFHSVCTKLPKKKKKKKKEKKKESKTKQNKKATNDVLSFCFLYILVKFCYFRSFEGSHSDRCEWSGTSLWVWYTFSWWLVRLSIFSCGSCPSICLLRSSALKMSFQFVCPLFN